MLVVIAIAASSVAFGQMKADKSLETKLIAMETKAWETWKNNDRSFIQSVLSDDAVFVDETGVSDKAQFIKNLYSGGCAVKSYAAGQLQVCNAGKRHGSDDLQSNSGCRLQRKKNTARSMGFVLVYKAQQ
jgi:hypothetical protein